MADITQQGETPETPAEPKEEGKLESKPTAEGEEFDKDRAMETIKKLRDIEKQYKQEKKELERLKADEAKRKEAEMSEIEKAQKRANDLEAELKRERSEKMRLKVAAKYQLPEAFANRLQGETEEELDADAKALAELLPKPQPEKKTPLLKANDIADGKVSKTDAQRRAEIYSRGESPFDLDSIKQNGGGVFFTEK